MERVRNVERIRFALGLTVGVSVALALGWLTGLRNALHDFVLVSGALAFFPFIVVVFAVLLCGSGAALIAWVTDSTDFFGTGTIESVITRGGFVFRRYYKLLWRLRKKPVAWGLGGGLALGAAGLAIALWFRVVPREAATLATLLEARAEIDAEHRRTRAYPEALGKELLDAFGRPILYRRDGSRPTASYVMLSLGFDGKESVDDICVSGRTHLMALIDYAHPLETLTALREGGLGAVQRARALRESRCSRLPSSGLR